MLLLISPFVDTFRVPLGRETTVIRQLVRIQVISRVHVTQLILQILKVPLQLNFQSLVLIVTPSSHIIDLTPKLITPLRHRLPSPTLHTRFLISQRRKLPLVTIHQTITFITVCVFHHAQFHIVRMSHFVKVPFSRLA